MKITITGASGLLGTKLVERLRARGDEVTTLSRNPSSPGAVAWQPEDEPAPTAALAGRDAVVHLAGENVSQRWSDDAKRRIRSSRELGTRHLVAGIEAAEPRPRVLVSSSAVGYYGEHGDERLDEQTPAAGDFLAEVCVVWEREAFRAADHRPARVPPPHRRRCSTRAAARWRRCSRSSSWASAARSRAARSTCPGSTSMTWSASTSRRSTATPGRARSTRALPSPSPTRRSHALSAAPSTAPPSRPCPALAVRTLYGEMAEIVTKSQRVIPRRAQELGYRFEHPDLDEALRSALE